MAISTFSNQYGSYSPTNFANQFVNVAKNKENMATQTGYYPPQFSQQFIQRATNKPASTQEQLASGYPSLGGIPNIPGQGVPGYMTPQQQSVMGGPDPGPWGTGPTMGPVVDGRVQTGGGSFTPEGYYSTGYQGSGEAPWIKGESSPGEYKSGGFGSIYTPDLSNPSKVAEYNRYLQAQGLPPLTGDPNQIAAEYNKTGSYTPPEKVLSYTMPGKTGYTGQMAPPTETAQKTSAGATGSWEAPDTSLLGSITRQLQQGASSLGSNIASGLTGAIGRAIKPASSAYAAEEPITAPETQGGLGGLWEGIKRRIGLSRPEGAPPLEFGGIGSNLGNALDVIGQIFNLPEMGLSEGLAGGYTAGTRVAPTSVGTFGELPVVNVGRLTDNQPLFDTQTQQTTETAPTYTPPAGGGNFEGVFQTPQVGDFLTELMNEMLSVSPEQFAMVDTGSMDAWYQDALEQSGMNEQQAALEAINKQIGVVSDLLDNLDADITEESKNFLMTEAQRRRLVATRGKPLRDQLTKLVAGASKYGVNIKNTLTMLQQQIGMKRDEVKQRLEAQKSVEASKQDKLKNLTNLLPYLGYTTGGQELQAKTSKEVAAMKNEENLF